MTSDTVVWRAGLPLSAQVDGEIVMFHPDSGAYFSLGEVGSRIWELIDAPSSIAALCTRLVDEYEVEPDRCRAEVEAFVAELRDAGLVELTE